MKKSVLFYALLLALLICSGINAQSLYTSQQFDNRNGLSNSCINDIFQDSDNLIWMATWDGLNLFNSSSFHVFNYSKGNISNSIASNVIYQINEDKKDNIWICTVSGISRYNKSKGIFQHFFYKQNTPGQGFILAIDSDGVVYTATNYSSSINVFDNNSNTFKPLHLKNLGEGLIVKISFDSDGNLWILKDNGLLETFTKTGKGFIKQPYTFKETDNFFYVNKKLFYISKKQELYEISDNFLSNKVQVLPHQVRSMAFYQNKYIFAWSSKGLGEYDLHFKPSQSLSAAVPALKNFRITSLLAGKEQILWVGTDGNGSVKITKKNDYIHVVQRQPNGQPFNIPIRAFCDVNGELWVGTKGNGIITIRNLGKENVSFSSINSFHTGIDLLDNCVYSIQKGTDDLVYIGSDAAGITVYDLKQKKLVKWEDISNSDKYPAFNSVHSVLSDADGSVWMGLNSNGLVHLKLDRLPDGKLEVRNLEHFSYTGTETGPGSNVIYTLAEGSNNTIWVGCRYGGLSLFDKRTKKFKTFKAFSYDGSLSNNDVLSLYKDKKNRLWIGTSFGLNWIKESESGKQNLFFKKLHDENGLPNNTIHAVQEDDDGNIWVSTNKGLAKVDPQTLKIIQFKEADGLQSDEFSDNAVWKNKDGYLFFGGIYGFNYFQPQQIQTNTIQPNLLLSELKLAGRNKSGNSFTVLNSKNSFVPATYKLATEDNFFELKLQPVLFSNPQKCQYAYFLEGHDKVWHYSGQDPKIFYSNIPPGDYTLLVKWTNGEGVWTKEVAAFNLTIKQYFWLTLPAFLCYFILAGFAGFLVVRYRKNKFIMDQKLILEHSLRRKDEEVHQEQLNFFTNIAHELQTPLTLILGAIDRYFYKAERSEKKSSGHYFLSIVKQEASRLHYLVHQLLEFRKAESGSLVNQYSVLNISNLLTNISKLFEPLSEQKSLEYSIHIEQGIELYTDKDKVEKIIYNLLSNAFKHCKNRQHIVFSVNQVSEQLELVVANSGCNLSENDLNKIFNRFFVLDGSQQSKISSGIGLAFTRQLVSLLKGTIEVKCENNWISFKVLLPLNKEMIYQKTVSDGDRAEKPSYIIQSLTYDSLDVKQETIVENNKKALLTSFEENNRKNILIVEDDASIRFLLKDILSENYIVYEAGNGREALNVMNKMIPHLIVSDIMMPDMNGLQLCNVVKNTPNSCHIPFILLTARGTVEQKIEGYEVGADAYIPKPFHAEHLLVRIRKLLEYQERLYTLFSQDQFSDKIGDAGLKESDKSFIEQLVKIIENNLDNESLDAAFIEKELAVSRTALYRKLKSLSNMTPGELIRNIRLQEAARLLKSTDLTVSEIFYRTGFNNQSYFYREFKKMYSYSPNEFRALQRLPGIQVI
ncbi:hybrid sensor histidine kinase/response regulator transcription factor [Rubrolithibacter danxiaensis]|uniref:hybrid sensor histidine kinase/response regulator transcription factor n=1 Tax=Rubrolithibacter danxiaensis TaxID=3390805 RepID=UPI003BF7E147